MVDAKPRNWLSVNYRLVMVGVLLIAAFLRLHGLNNVSPPGLEHDEVAHWLINQDILDGNHSLYFSGAYGHEAGYHYLQSGFMVLLGDNALALRLPSAFLGLLVVAVSFALARRLFGLRVAVLSSSLLAVLFWPVFYSRLGLRAISLPLLSGLSAYFWWVGWKYRSADDLLAKGQKPRVEAKSSRQSESSKRVFLYFALAGLFAGLSFYTYMASRVVPIFYVLFALYLVLLHREEFRRRWRGVLLFFVVYLVVAAPLALYLTGNPGVEYRLSEINQPLNSLLEGSIRPALENVLSIIAMFGIRGDPLWRQNIAFLPVFEPILAIFFYTGVVISITRWREQRYVFILLWLLTAAIPSIVTIDAPSSIRIINALPVLTMFPVIGLEVINFLGRFSTVFTKLSTKNARILAFIGLLIVFAFYIARTSWATFQEWPESNEVKFVWQEALTEIAAYLDDHESMTSVALGGWTPYSMDPPTMDLSLARQDLEIRYFDPNLGLIVPTGNQHEGEVGIVRPSSLPLDPFLEEILVSWGATPKMLGSFTLYAVPPEIAVDPEFLPAPAGQRREYRGSG
jgi:4-amino-4-deoxy-L-arabinose transferase-like glycosyltransferase